MSTYNVPASLAEAKRELGALAQLLTASEWQRACTVFAFTADGRGQAGKSPTTPLPIRDFADQGIYGLTDEGTVRAYRAAWLAYGDTSAKPGRRVKLPTEPWVDAEGASVLTRVSAKHARRYTERDPGAFARSIDRGEVKAEALAQDLSDAAAEAIVARVLEDRPNVFHRAVRSVRGGERAPLAPVGDPEEFAAVGAAMEDSRVTDRLSTAVYSFLERVRSADEAGDKGRKERLLMMGEHQAELLAVGLDVCRGVSDADLATLLEG